MDNNTNFEGGPSNNKNSNQNSGGSNGSGGKGGPGGNDRQPRKQNLLFLLVASLITLLCMSYFMKAFSSATTKEIPYNEFVTMLNNGEVDSVYIKSDI